MATVFEGPLAKTAVPSDEATQRKTRTPGEGGTWIFILGEMLVFLALFAFFLFNRIKDPNLFRTSQPLVDKTLGLVYTLVLLVSSLLVVGGIQAIRRRNTALAPWLLVGAAVCGIVFIALKCVEWAHHLNQDQTISTNEFWTWYYVLTGTHALHVLIGLGFLAFMIVEARKPKLNGEQFALVEGGACYWHMVDLIWIILFPLIYLMV